jgi:tripartite-type tricarboxylate transporter receptor subunit TctC
MNAAASRADVSADPSRTNPTTGIAACVPPSARAQACPTRPVRWIIGFPPGGGPDMIVRPLGQWLSERLGQQFIIENRPGAASNIATEAVVRASPDGYTLLFVVTTNTINATLYEKLDFNFIRDIAPVASIGRAPFILVVNPSVPAKTVPEFIAYAKANPGKLNMVSNGNGTSNHVFGELFKELAGVNLVHVPYRSSFYPDLLGGQVQVAFMPISGVMGYIRAG